MGQHTTNKTPPFQVNRSARFSEDEGGRDRVVLQGCCVPRGLCSRELCSKGLCPMGLCPRGLSSSGLCSGGVVLQGIVFQGGCVSGVGGGGMITNVCIPWNPLTRMNLWNSIFKKYSWCAKGARDAS
jgi:hypothetical protein